MPVVTQHLRGGECGILYIVLPMMSCYCVIVVMFIVVMLYFLSLHYLYQPALVFCQLSNNSLRAYYLLLEAAILHIIILRFFT